MTVKGEIVAKSPVYQDNPPTRLVTMKHKNIPPIRKDMVEVIRCKDCKNYRYSDFHGAYICEREDNTWEPDDYCSYAEH